MDIELDQRPVTDAAETVDLTGLDDQDVTRSGFEFLSVHGPETAAFSHELDLVVRMTMGPGTTTGKGAEEEYGDTHIAVICPDELMRAPLKGQVLLTYAIHPAGAPNLGVFDPSTTLLSHQCHGYSRREERRENAYSGTGEKAPRAMRGPQRRRDVDQQKEELGSDKYAPRRLEALGDKERLQRRKYRGRGSHEQGREVADDVCHGQDLHHRPDRHTERRLAPE
jgi:hypothetical protein